MLNLVKSTVPEIYPYVYQCYSKTSNLFFGMSSENGCVIDSEEGVQHGDPRGPFLFSLTINPLIKSLQSELNIWYLDDGTVASDIETVLSDYQRILDAATNLGLTVNPNKCELCIINPQSVDTSIALNRFCELTDDIRLIQKEDLTLLGAAVLPEAIENMLIAKREKLILMSQRLLEIDKHDALFLLKNCYSIPKLTYVLRTVPCFTRPDILQTYDLIIKEALENILNTSLKQDSCWIQSTLPVNLGGFGNRLASEIALPAYLSSVRASIGTTSSLLTPEIQQDRNAFYEKGCQE